MFAYGVGGRRIYTVGQKILPPPPERVLKFIFQRQTFLSDISHAYTALKLYSKLQIFIQVFLTLTKICHIKCDYAENFCISLEGPLYRFLHRKVSIITKLTRPQST